MVFDTNLKGPFFLSQRAANEMIRQIDAGTIPDGKIINVSSISAYAISLNRADYCMSKAAMVTMTRLFAQRLAEHRIGVFEVCPGVIDSDMTAPVREKYDRLIAEGLWPIRRWGQPDDVAKTVAAIVSDYFPFSTGQTFHVDGGFHIRLGGPRSVVAAGLARGTAVIMEHGPPCDGVSVWVAVTIIPNTAAARMPILALEYRASESSTPPLVGDSPCDNCRNIGPFG